MEAALGAVADAGLTPCDIDGVVGPGRRDRLHLPAPDRPGVAVHVGCRASPRCSRRRMAIATGLATTVLIAVGLGRACTPNASRPRRGPGRPTSSCAGFGMFTAAEFALVARRHMHLYGTTPESLATVAADHPQQRPRQPRRRVPRAGAVHVRGHPRQPDGRRPVPPARLRDDVRGRLRAGADPADRVPGRAEASRSTSSAGTSTTTGPPYQTPAGVRPRRPAAP